MKSKIRVFNEEADIMRDTLHTNSLEYTEKKAPPNWIDFYVDHHDGEQIFMLGRDFKSMKIEHSLLKRETSTKTKGRKL